MAESLQIKLHGPLDVGALLFRSLRGEEELGRLYEFELELDSPLATLPFDDILGQNLTVEVGTVDGPSRFFNGFVSRFRQVGQMGDFVRYQATLRPWLWFLTRVADCRIFQGMTVPEIIKDVFRSQGFSDFEELLTGSYRTWEYCVQYRETDFNFVSRLMEQEGIYYYFVHDQGKHSLVLSDSYSSHELLPGLEMIPYYPPGDHAVREGHISEWVITRAVQPGAYALNDFDFEKPRASLAMMSSVSRQHDRADYAVYDYPGEYREPADGETYARVRLEELQTQHEQIQATGDALGLGVGGLFALFGYPREDQNREVLILAAAHELEQQAFRSGADAGETSYECRFTAAESQQPYRTARTTPKPVVQGPQTAVVVGKAGEEIWTDKYGRVKVQFHWDREGKADENSSCWVRVAQLWAGKGWGGIHIPRIGQEVIVEFLEGDPDRPIITGRVYNADCMPPYGLPSEQNVSGLKSDSTKGGGGYNELVMDDSKGSELLRIHGQKDMDTTVENDLREHVLNNRSRDVAVDETVAVGSNQTYTIGADQSGTVGANKTIAVGANHDETIGSNQSTRIGKNKTETIAINKAETIGAAKELTIGGAYQVTVGAVMNETVGGAKAEEIGAAKAVVVGGSSSETVGSDKSVSAGKSISETAGTDVSINAGKKMAFEAGDEISITTGKASIVLKKDGTIQIQGKDITIKGSGAISVKASKDVVVKGKKILQN